MGSLKTQRLLKADPPRCSRGDETETPYEEDARFVDCFLFDALEFIGKKWGERIPQIDRQRSGADDGPVVELNFIWLVRGAKLARLLQISDRVNERCIGPRFRSASGLGGRDNVGSRLFNYAEPIKF
jgi:hypothetical protein